MYTFKKKYVLGKVKRVSTFWLVSKLKVTYVFG